MFYSSTIICKFIESYNKNILKLATETHKGLRRMADIFTLSNPRVFSLSQVHVLYLEREEEITDQSNFIKGGTGWNSSSNDGENVQKRHLKVYSRCVKLLLFHLVHFV